MKIALLVCRGREHVDSVITETDLTLLGYIKQYGTDKGYYSISILGEEEKQVRALIQTHSGEQSVDNTLGLIAFTTELDDD